MRIRYEDEASQTGELDLRQVQAGDRLRFVSDFEKRAGPQGILRVARGELGSVVSCGPESLTVATRGLRTAGDETALQAHEFELDATELGVIAMLVDSRDPRVAGGRSHIRDACGIRTYSRADLKRI